MIHSWNRSRIIPESVGPYARALTTRRQEGPQGEGVVGRLCIPTHYPRDLRVPAPSPDQRQAAMR